MEYISELLAHESLAITIFGNSLGDYVAALIIFGIALVGFSILQWVVLKRLHALAQKTATDIDDTLVRIVRSLKPPFYVFVSFYFATLSLSVPGIAQQVINGILIVWIVFQIVQAAHILIDYVLTRRAEASGADTKTAYGFLGNIIKGAVWVIALLMVLSNLGVNVTSLIAGLGIGGVAVAFALQNILADLFSSFAIYFDKPFQVGDFIIVGDRVGTVEHIGIKSTRLRALQGEEIIISNQELTSASIQNFRKLNERRIVFSIGVLYETKPKLLEAIPSMIEKIITDAPNVRFDRAHFSKFGDSALEYEIVYYVTTNDFVAYMDAQQEINNQLVTAFAEKGIEFAYPTQTLYVKK